jgi:hypothetical protein
MASRAWLSKVSLEAIQLPQPMDLQRSMIQSADGQLVVVRTTEGAMWQICSGGVCVQAHSGVRIIELYRQLLISQGRPVPEG